MTADASPQAVRLRREAMAIDRRPRPGSDAWQPVLLHVPDSVRRARADWAPVLMHGWTLTAVGLIALFLALQFLIPARLVIGGMGAVGRPSVAIGLLLGFLWAVSAIRRHQLPAGRQPVRWVVGIFLGVQLLGHAIGYDRLPSVIESSAADRWLIFSFAISGTILFIADGVRTRDELDRVLRLLVFFTTVMAVVGILQFAGIVDLTRFIQIPGLRSNGELVGIASRGSTNVARVAGTASHYIEFGVVLALVLPLAVHYAMFARDPRSRRWRWVAAAMIAAGVPLAVSRSAVLTVLVSLAFTALVWPWRQRYNIAVITVIGAAAFHMVSRGLFGTLRALFLQAGDDPSVTARIERTGTVMQLFEQRPWFGYGSGMVTPEAFLLLDNQFYVTLLASGIIGVIGLTVFFLIPYLMGRSVRLRGQDQETRHLGNALAATMPAAVLASGTFDSFSFATFVGVMCVLIGATGALWRVDGTRVSNPIQVAAPGDKYVTTPLMADFRERLRDAWEQTRPRNYGRRSRAAE